MSAPVELAKKHPRHQLDERLQNSARFSIMAALARVGTLNFGALRDTVELSDSALSKHISALETAGYVTLSKAFIGKLPRTSVAVTTAGAKAWKDHLRALRAIAQDF